MSIYKRFCKEQPDASGKAPQLTLTYPDNFNFGYDVLDVLAAEHPNQTALVWCNTENEEHTFTFEDIRIGSNRIANVLWQSGIRRGDKVLVVLKRHYEYWFVAIALHKLGAILIPATHMLTTADYLYRMQVSQIRAVICTPQNEVPRNMQAAIRQLPNPCTLWCVQKSMDGFRNLTEEMREADTQFARLETRATDPMLLYFTSGTTGYPKGVMHDFTYPLAHIVTAKYWQQAEEGGLHFTVAETGWAKASWGKIYGQWLVGSAVMVYDFDTFDPRQLVAVINQYGVTSFCAPPTVYRYLVRKGIPAMPSLKHASTAGELLAPEVFQRFTQQTGLELHEGYGQTETALLLGNFRGATAVQGSMGTISPLYRIELHSPTGEPTPIGEIGEIVVIPTKPGQKPVGIFCSYLNQEEQYRSVWRGGVYHTGDAAYQDENGRFWFHGRIDDIIKTGGFRVGPDEVETVLRQHPAVLECAVIGVPDPLRGQAIQAMVQLTDGTLPSKELELQIREFCNQKLAEYKWVRTIEFVTEMPKTISGKIRRHALKEQLVQAASVNRNALR